MPIPKSSRQTIVYTAANALIEGKSESETEAVVLRVHNYLNAADLPGILAEAKVAVGRAGKLNSVLGALGLERGLFLSFERANEQHFAEYVATYKLDNGQTEYRTVRVPVKSGNSVSDYRDAAMGLAEEVVDDSDGSYFGDNTVTSITVSARLIL